MNYNDGKWHGWNGGECPVHPETVVEVRWESDYAAQTGQAGKFGGASQWTWEEYGSNRIVAFRVIREHREPREWWIYGAEAFDSEQCASDTASYEGAKPGSVIHVREVIDE